MKKLFVFLCLLNSGFCGVLLINDSPFMLVAEIQGANGIMLNQVTVAPGEQTNWTQDFSSTPLSVPANASVSMTPYRVLWKCAYGGYYATCVGVSPGSLVRASMCQGVHFCNPKEDEEDEDKQQCPPCVCPECGSSTDSTSETKEAPQNNTTSSSG